MKMDTLEMREPRPQVRSQRAHEVARYFSLPTGSINASGRLPRVNELLPAPGQIVYITGPSGSGKSQLLRALKSSAPSRWIDLQLLLLPDRPVIDCIEGRSVEAALQLLSQAGLCEAWTYLRTPGELSDGQRWRLRLAMGIDLALRADAPVILACDEFAAVLDRITAQVVAHAFARLVRRSQLSAIVVSSHEDLLRALDANVTAVCDFERVTVRMKRPRKGQAH